MQDSLTATVASPAEQDRPSAEVGVRYDQATMTLSKRLRAAIRIDAINGTREDRQVVASQIGEAAGTIDRLLAEKQAVQAQLNEAIRILAELRACHNLNLPAKAIRKYGEAADNFLAKVQP